jgi:small subunit ribosomal protein S1
MLVAAIFPMSALVRLAGGYREMPDVVAVESRAGRAPTCVATMQANTFAISNPGSLTKDERMRSRYGLAYEPEGGWENEQGVLFSYDELASSMREIATFDRGDMTTGQVIGFEPNGALVDIGVKSSAYCSLQEMALVKPDKPEHCLKLGEKYEFVIVSREDENGQLMLSRRRILFSQAWDKVAKLYAEDAVVDGEVSAVNRGGAMMLVEGLRAFLPGSHFLAGQTPTEEFVGRKMEVKFLDVDKETTRLVVSHRKAVVDSQIHDLSVGSVLKGVVTAVKPYGAFVDIGGLSGLLHISQVGMHLRMSPCSARGGVPHRCTAFIARRSRATTSRASSPSFPSARRSSAWSSLRTRARGASRSRRRPSSRSRAI